MPQEVVVGRGLVCCMQHLAQTGRAGSRRVRVLEEPLGFCRLAGRLLLGGCWIQGAQGSSCVRYYTAEGRC
jgi:hypothetical protein